LVHVVNLDAVGVEELAVLGLGGRGRDEDARGEEAYGRSEPKSTPTQ
jgi:hypothetical protein